MEIIFHKKQSLRKRINYMFDKLVIEVFNKAKEEIQSDVVTHASRYLTDVLWNRFKYQISERTLRNYYKKAMAEQKEHNFKISLELSQHFSQYLGYEDYYSFILNHKPKPMKTSESIFPYFLISVFFLTCFMIYHRVMFDNKTYTKSTNTPKAIMVSKRYYIDIDHRTKHIDHTNSYEMFPTHILFDEHQNNSKEIFSIMTFEKIYIIPIPSTSLKLETQVSR